MGSLVPPDWGIEVNTTLYKLGMHKTQLARMLNVNYTNMCNVIKGRRVDIKMQDKIIAKIQELEARQGQAVEVGEAV
ncbi:MAG: hypothetical protein FWG63_01845 [Defluviitaleaceae bacterium]|nr:hypothetical protein [Defluviitaleaceae bacterium]